MVLGQTCEHGDRCRLQRLPVRSDDVMESTYDITVPLRSRERQTGAEDLGEGPAGSRAVKLDNLRVRAVAHGAYGESWRASKSAGVYLFVRRRSLPRWL